MLFLKKKVGGLDPDFFAFDSCLVDLSADRDVEFALLIVSSYLCSKKQQSLKSRSDHRLRKSIAAA